MSSRLNSQIYLIPLYNITRRIFGLPSKEKVEKATEKLIFLSRGVVKSAGVRGSENAQAADTVRELLGIYVTKEDNVLS